MKYLSFINQCWESGQLLFLVTALQCSICLILYILCERESNVIVSLPDSRIIICLSLVANIGAAIPLALDVVYDSVSSFMFRDSKCRTGWFCRVILICSILFPNLFIILCLNGAYSSNLVLCISMIRNILFIYGLFGYLWSSNNFFQCHLFFSIYLASTTSYIVYEIRHGWIDNRALALIENISWCTCIVGLFLMSINWRGELRKIPWKLISASDILCTIYLGAIIILNIIFTSFFYFFSDTFLLLTVIHGAITIGVISLNSMALMYEVAVTQKMLEMKRNFVRFVSHEIRTPLNTVNLGLELIQRDLNGAVATGVIDTVNDIQGAVYISLDILNDLLSYEKLEAGIMVLEKTFVCAWEFLVEVIKPFTLQARQLGIDLVIPTESDADLEILQNTRIYVDKNRLAQVMRNLISNALKFTPSGGQVKIKSRLCSRISGSNSSGDSDNSMLQISVTDTGAGLSKENLPRIFHEIIQFNASKLQKGGGSGLGLWISKAIIDLHEGKISVVSDGEGLGCRFNVDIPLVQASSLRQEDSLTSPTDSNIRAWTNIFATPPTVYRTLMNTVSQSSARQSYSPIPESQTELTTFKYEPAAEEEETKRTKPLNTKKTRSSALSFMHKVRDDNAGVNREESVVARSLESENYSPAASVEHTSDVEDTLSLATKKCPVLRRKRVLIVDDAPLNRKMLAHLLSRDYEIKAVEDGDIATSIIVDSMGTVSEYDVVLMDYKMPNMDGPTAARIMRSAGYEGIIIGVTGNGLSSDIATFVEHGAEKVLVKPIGLKSIEDAIHSLRHRSNILKKST